MLPSCCKHVHLGKEKRQHHFLLQPLNLSPGATVRNPSALTSTSRVGAAICSLSVLRVLTTTFLTNVLSSACLSSSQGCTSPSALTNRPVTSPVLRGAISQREIISPAPPAKWVFYYPERGLMEHWNMCSCCISSKTSNSQTCYRLHFTGTLLRSTAHSKGSLKHMDV